VREDYRMIEIWRGLLIIALVLLPFLYSSTAAADMVRGLENYLAILKGQRTVQQLSPEELREVISIHSRLEGQGGGDKITTGGFEIQASANDEWFLINGEKYQAKTYCFNFEKGDQVKFIDGSPYGVCISAKLVDLRTNQICEVWCE
jgi:hypothetical protein